MPSLSGHTPSEAASSRTRSFAMKTTPTNPDVLRGLRLVNLNKRDNTSLRWIARRELCLWITRQHVDGEYPHSLLSYLYFSQAYYSALSSDWIFHSTRKFLKKNYLLFRLSCRKQFKFSLTWFREVNGFTFLIWKDICSCALQDSREVLCYLFVISWFLPCMIYDTVETAVQLFKWYRRYMNMYSFKPLFALMWYTFIHLAQGSRICQHSFIFKILHTQRFLMNEKNVLERIFLLISEHAENLRSDCGCL